MTVFVCLNSILVVEDAMYINKIVCENVGPIESISIKPRFNSAANLFCCHKLWMHYMSLQM